jgi:hypothetical protein
MLTIVIVIVSVLLVLFVVYSIVTQKYDNPYKTDLYVGVKGAGKSMFLAKRAYKYYKKFPERRIYTNFDIDIPHDLVNPRTLHLFDYPVESLILIDEVGIYYDNRDFKTFPVGLADWFKNTRKFKLRVLMASHRADIDIKIRSVVDNTFVVTRLCRVIVLAKACAVHVGISGLDKEGVGIVENDIVQYYDRHGLLSLLWLPKYCKLYNSNKVFDRADTFEVGGGGGQA